MKSDQDLAKLAQVKLKLDYLALHPRFEVGYSLKNDIIVERPKQVT